MQRRRGILQYATCIKDFPPIFSHLIHFNCRILQQIQSIDYHAIYPLVSFPVSFKDKPIKGFLYLYRVDAFLQPEIGTVYAYFRCAVFLCA